MIDSVSFWMIVGVTVFLIIAVIAGLRAMALGIADSDDHADYTVRDKKPVAIQPADYERGEL